jgi:HEPN domain-containing protein
MMTKEEHIEYWLKGAKRDWKSTQDLFNNKDYMHSLVWAHLTLEKIAKAHWVKTHQDNYPPRIHNIVTILEQSDITLDDTMMDFLSFMNDFQVAGRYPDYLDKLYKRCRKDYTQRQLEKIKEVRTCLLKMMQ